MSYYQMHRGWMDNELFERDPFNARTAWCWLIEHAAWETTIVRVERTPVQLKRGQLSFSEAFLAEAWGWAKSRVHRFLKDLATFGMISREDSPTRKSERSSNRPQSIITICNYNKYQVSSVTDEPMDKSTLNRERTESEPNNKKERIQEDSDSSNEESGDLAKMIFDAAIRIITRAGVPEKSARSHAGRWRQALRDDGRLIAILLAAERQSPIDPVGYISKAVNNATTVNGFPATGFG